MSKFDKHANLAVSQVATAPSPATSGTSLVVTASDGALFPVAPFDATIWPNGQLPTHANAEIARCTGVSTDTLTLVRAQYGTTARTVVVGDMVANTATVKVFTDAEAAILQAGLTPKPSARFWPQALSPGAPALTVQSTPASDGKYNQAPWVCAGKFGKLFATCREGTSHTSTNGKVSLQTSTDGGVTWSAKTYLASPASGHDYRDASIVCTHTGRLIVNFFDYNGSAIIGLYSMTSDDSGASWSSPALVSPFTSWSATSAAILQHSSGALLWPIYGQDSGDTADRFSVLISYDDGVTWSSRVDVTAANTAMNEASLVEFADGSIHAFIRNDSDGKVYTASSSDYGQTWGSTTVVVASATAGRPAAIIVPVSQALILFYRSVTAEKAVYRYSLDYGATWSSEIIYSSSVYQYAGGFAIADNLAAFVVCLGGDLASTSDLLFGVMEIGAPDFARDYTAKGDLLVATGEFTYDVRHVGSNTQVLTADSTQPDGVKWAAPPSGAVSSVFTRTGAVVAVTGDYGGVVSAFLTGATAAARFVGATTSGAPASGTFAVGDFVVAQNGHLFVCTAAGTPGTWADVGTAGTLTSPLTTKGDVWGYSTVDARVPVGSNGQVLTADSTQTLGLKWATPSGGGSAVLDLVERSTDLVVTAASAAAAQSWITGNSVTYDGSTRVLIEIQCPVANADASNEIICNIWEDSTDLGRVANVDSAGPVTAGLIRTPSAAAHVYTAKVWKGSGSGRQFSSGASSASGPMVNSFLRVTAS